MPEATQYTFTFKELVETLIKKQDLHEGMWGLYVKFGINAGNISFGGADHLPTAMVPILEIGIQKQDQPSSLVVDAAVVNPLPIKTKKRSPK